MRASKNRKAVPNKINDRRKPGMRAASIPSRAAAAVVVAIAAFGSASALAQPSPGLAKNFGDPTLCGCGGTADPGPNALAGNSINTAVGNVFLSETDFQGAPVTGLALTRHYNSRDTTQSAFGTGWLSTWHRKLDAVSSTQVTVTRADGRQDTFTLQAGAWKADPDVTSRLSAVPSGGTQTGWQLVTADDTTETYALTGQLNSITSRAGLTTTLGHDTNGNLTTVTGPFGDVLGFTNDASGRVTQMTAPDGGVYSYTYDTNDDLTSVTHPDKTVRKYSYSNTSFPHALTAIIDENGANFASWTYDTMERALSSQHAGGADRTKVTYNPDGSASVTDGDGHSHSYKFMTQFGVVKPTTVTGAPYPAAGGAAFSYGATGFVASRTDFDGNLTTYTHDARGDQTSCTEAAGTALARTIKTTWLPSFHLPSRIVEPGRTTTLSHDAMGNLLKKTVAAGSLTRSWTYSYNGAGQALTATDPNGNVTTRTYAAKGRLATVIDALGHVSKFTGYDLNGRPTSFTDPNGLLTKLEYNFRSEVAMRDVGGEITKNAFDHAGQLTKTTRPDGSFLTFQHDAAHRLTAIADALGERIEAKYDDASNLTKIQSLDAAAEVQMLRSYAYDQGNRVAKAIGAVGETTSYSYDPNGNLLAAIDALANARNYAYDVLNRLVQATDPNGGITTNTYDLLDHLTAVTDPRGLKTTYTWNGLDEETAVASPDSGTTMQTFDPAGNVATSTDARGMTTTYSHDALNRPISATYADGKTVTWGYDQGTNGVGHLTRMIDTSGQTAWTYEPHGRQLTQKQTTAGHVFMTKRTYDSGGRLASLTYPSGAAVVRSYDPAGRVGSLKSGTTTLAGGIGYLPFGPTTGWAQGNGASYGRTYDKDERLAVIGLGSSGNMLLTHDAASQIVKIDETDVNPKLFVHDPAGQLTTYSDLANPITPFLGYSYDPDGNRITLNENKGASVITSILPAISNLLGGTSGAATRTLSYDKDGSTTLDHRVVTVLGYTFDAGERLVKAKTGAFTTTYLNDGLGRRVSRAGYGAQGIAGGKQEFVHDLEGHLLGEYDGNGKAIEETVWLLDRGSNPGQAPGSSAEEVLPVAVLIPGQTPDYVAADQLGAPHQIANSSRNLVWRWDHDPFGNGAPTGTLIYNPRFLGQYFDKETGFDYNGRRDYDPTTGRYVESDPIGLKGGINTYGYAGNNPVDLSDARGLAPGVRFEEQNYCFDIDCVEFERGSISIRSRQSR